MEVTSTSTINPILWPVESPNLSIIRPSIKWICLLIPLTIIYHKVLWLCLTTNQDKTSIYLQVVFHMKKWRDWLPFLAKITLVKSLCKLQMTKCPRCKELVVEVTAVTTIRECQVCLTAFKDKLVAQDQVLLHLSCIRKTCWVKERDKATTACQST